MSASWVVHKFGGTSLAHVERALRDLVQTGDEGRKIEGVLSGTLSFILNSFDGSSPFSPIVRQARAKGFTEPDPRDGAQDPGAGPEVTAVGVFAELRRLVSYLGGSLA